MIHTGMREKSIFRFRQFAVHQDRATMKVGTDGVLLGAWVRLHEASRILDIGAGTGVIALMLAQRSPQNTRIDAVEQSPEDAQQAAENFAASPWKDRLALYTSAIQAYHTPFTYDLIVSNPPYFINSLLPPDEKRKQTRHTLSLTQEELLTHSLRLLAPSGYLNLVLPREEASRFIRLATASGLHCSRQTSFRSRKHKPVKRMLLEFTRLGMENEINDLILYDENNNWSEAYRHLTGDFYLTN